MKIAFNMNSNEHDIVNIMLNALQVVAEKNACSMCRGLLYEPKVPDLINVKIDADE